MLGFTGSLTVDDSGSTENDIHCFFADGVSTGHAEVDGDDKEDAGPEWMPVTDCGVDLGDSKGEALCVGNNNTPLDPEVKKMMKVVVVWKIKRLCQVLHKTRRGQFCLRAMN